MYFKFGSSHTLALLAAASSWGTYFTAPALAQDRQEEQSPSAQPAHQEAISTEQSTDSSTPSADNQEEIQGEPTEETTTAAPEGVEEPYTDEYAETSLDEENKLPFDVDQAESTGLLVQTDGLGSGLYHDSSRRVLTEIMPKIPADTPWIGLKNLYNRFLLTAADSKQIKNDTDETNRVNLLTLRLESLLRRGMNVQAFELYTKVSNVSDQDQLAQAGILSQLFNREKALACIDMKAMLPRFGKTGFWAEIDAYCVLTLTGTTSPEQAAVINASSNNILKMLSKSPGYRMVYTPETFETLSLFERAVITAEGNLDISGLKVTDYNNLPAAHIQAILAQSGLDFTHRIVLTGAAVRKGVLPSSTLVKLYKEVQITYKDKKGFIPPGAENIALLYRDLHDTDHDFLKKREFLLSALALSDQYGIGILAPFVPTMVEYAPVTDIEDKYLDTALTLLIMEKTVTPSLWVNKIKGIEAKSPADKIRLDRLFLAAYLLARHDEMSKDQVEHAKTILGGTKDAAVLNLKNIIENIDNAEPLYARVPYIYENDFDLAMNKGYTMPPVVFMDELKRAGEESITGDTIMLSNLVMQGGTVDDTHGTVLLAVAGSLKNVGLTRFAKEILAQAILFGRK